MVAREKTRLFGSSIPQEKIMSAFLAFDVIIQYSRKSSSNVLTVASQNILPFRSSK